MLSLRAISRRKDATKEVAEHGSSTHERARARAHLPHATCLGDQQAAALLNKSGRAKQCEGLCRFHCASPTHNQLASLSFARNCRSTATIRPHTALWRAGRRPAPNRLMSNLPTPTLVTTQIRRPDHPNRTRTSPHTQPRSRRRYPQTPRIHEAAHQHNPTGDSDKGRGCCFPLRLRGPRTLLSYAFLGGNSDNLGLLPNS